MIKYKLMACRDISKPHIGNTSTTKRHTIWDTFYTQTNHVSGIYGQLIRYTANINWTNVLPSHPKLLCDMRINFTCKYTSDSAETSSIWMMMWKILIDQRPFHIQVDINTAPQLSRILPTSVFHSPEAVVSGYPHVWYGVIKAGNIEDRKY